MIRPVCASPLEVSLRSPTFVLGVMDMIERELECVCVCLYATCQFEQSVLADD